MLQFKVALINDGIFIIDKKLEITEQRVAVCRDHVNGICKRQQCKYYHIPIELPSALEMASSITDSL